uniref:Cytochrome b/b6 domain protein n=1 Tax=Cyanothece sp. (strain PCC 7425 / ATCC 29141) TaxID=395961 RepID=B8HUD2_CYAP4
MVQFLSGPALRRFSTLLAISILTLVAIAGTSGVLLAFYYRPEAGGAYDAVQQITQEIPYGWLVQGLHNIAGNGIIVLGLIQMVVLFLGEQFRRSWLTAWISGILLILAAIGLSWTAMILDWSQIGYWRLSIELGTIQAIPLIGPSLRQIITGGGAIGTVTVEHLYAIHSYILAGIATLLAIVHLAGLVILERQQQAEALVSSAEHPQT